MKQKWYLYVLRSIGDGDLYIGITQNIYQRLKEHNGGMEPATVHRRPFNLVFYETFFDKQDAFLREKYFKTGWGRKHLRKALRNSLK